MPDTLPVDDAQAKQREQNRIRVARHRARKVKQGAFAEALNAVAADELKPSRAQSKQALLKNVLITEGVTVSRLVKKKVQALESTKLRQVGPQVVEVADMASQLRACDALTKDLQLAGELPDDTHGASPAPIVVNVLVLSGSGKGEMVPLPLQQSLEPSHEAPIVVHAGSSRDEALQKSRVDTYNSQ